MVQVPLAPAEPVQTNDVSPAAPPPPPVPWPPTPPPPETHPRCAQKPLRQAYEQGLLPSEQDCAQAAPGLGPQSATVTHERPPAPMPPLPDGQTGGPPITHAPLGSQ